MGRPRYPLNARAAIALRHREPRCRQPSASRAPARPNDRPAQPSAPTAAPRAGDLVPGLRTVPYRRRTIIGYRMVDGRVEVLRLVHGGQEWDEVADGEG